MNLWIALAVLLAIAGALALRLPQLDTRPLHNDEAVNAIKVSELWQQGRYHYDPDEYHGPTLHYATLPFLWLSAARNSDQLDDATLRLAPVAFGVGLILLLLLFVDGLGRQAVVWAAFFTAGSGSVSAAERGARAAWAPVPTRPRAWAAATRTAALASARAAIRARVAG